jgi:uncharacterized protein (DUF433 family)
MPPNKGEFRKRLRVRFEDKGISCRPGLMGGQACIDGTRIPIFMVQGWTAKEILRDWPFLTKEQVNAAIRYWNVRGWQRELMK